MSDQHEIRPPRWATRFLEWYCKPELLEDLQGDLNEYFDRHVKSKGVRRARLIFIVDVFKFFRLYTIRKPELINLLIHWIMITSYVKTSSRSIARNKFFSTINIVGLAISMSVGLLMIAFISDLRSYDRFHEKGDRIYRVISEDVNATGRKMELASTSVNAGKKIKDTFTGIENTVLLYRGLSADAMSGDKIIPLEGLWSTETFFQVFTFPLLSGDPRTALKDPYSIVLTEKSAKKLFGDDEALGKTLNLRSGNDTTTYTITAVMKDIPKFSHMQFDMLSSFATNDIKQKDSKEYMDWGNIYMSYIYVLLPENGNTDLLQTNLDKLCESENKALDHETIKFTLQPLFDIALGRDLSNQIGPTMMISLVWILGGLALVVILSACFNYTNLSIARALRRSREVGIRKVVGALRTHVLGQFIVESIMVSLFALAFSLVLFMFLRPQFKSLAPEFLNIVDLNLNAKVMSYFIGFAIVVGFIAGVVPAIFFSKINATKVLKDASSVKMFRNMSLRKGLIAVQYCLSIMFITATVIGYKQYKHFLAFDLGFNTANILNIEMQGNKAGELEKELLEMKEVETMSRSIMVTSVGSCWGGSMKYNDPHDSSVVWYNTIDERYIPLHGHKLLAGRNFQAKPGNGDETEVIVNEQLLKRFNIGGQDPAKALGEFITVDDKRLEIIGVTKDFHYDKAESKIEPVVFRYSNDINDVLNVKIISHDWPLTLAAIESKWKALDKVHSLKADFYDDQIKRAYGEYSAMTKVIGFLAFLAICISSMGLLGMVVYTTESRLKEVSLRKVLGASEGNLIYILGRGFIILLLVSASIALPLTYLFFENIVLADIANPAPIGFMDLFISVIVVMIIALLMIGSQTLKVARANPAEVLKTE